MMQFPDACARCAPGSKSLRPKVVALDLDGTALTDDWEPDPETAAALCGLRGRGIALVLATGRCGPNALGWAVRLGAPFVVPLNGAAALTADGHTLWTADGLPPAVLEQVWQLAARNLVGFHAHTASTWHPRGVDGNAVRRYAAHYGLQIPTARIPPSGPVLQVELYGREPALDTIHEALPDSLTVTRGVDFGGSYLDIAPRGVTKALGMEPVLSELGADWGDVLAIGNGDNDRDLFEASGWGVAVINSHPVLADVATHTVWLTPERGAVRTTLAALLDTDQEAAKHLHCLHRPSAITT
jgi:HAD superfamily hydrolase (TIGR01484 family)